MFPQLLEHPARVGSEFGGRRGIARQELEVDGFDAGRDCEPDPSASLGELRTGFGEDGSRFVEATEHPHRKGPVHA